MMHYDFDKVIDRKGSNSYKWDSADKKDVIPLWVADMDFPTAPAIREALQRRMEHGVFGYVKVPETYYEATINWFSRRHGWNIGRDEFIYTSGVVPAVSAIIKAMTTEGDKVLVQTPVYNCFFSSIRNNGCQMISNSLVYADNTYSIDFDDFERKASDPSVKIFLLCNPHNPAGRVWTREELSRLSEICHRHDVFVISDEIHCELVMSGYHYVPYATVAADSNYAICTSPSKSFNIAGLQIANICAPDAHIRQRIDKAININEVCDVNPFGVEALIAAYNNSEDWLQQLLVYIESNYVFAKEYLYEHMPLLKVTNLEGTYLMWVDFKVFNTSSEQMEEIMMEKYGVWLNAGTMYGADGEGFMRVNLACPRSVLSNGLQRVKAFYDDMIKKINKNIP